MNVVILRCHKCRTVLARVDAVAPDYWTQVAYVPRCAKKSCDLPDPRRITAYMQKKGIDGVPLGGEMPLWAIRGEIAKAEREGKDVVVSVRFSHQSDGLHLHLRS